jgi:hypothetical protein
MVINTKRNFLRQAAWTVAYRLGSVVAKIIVAASRTRLGSKGLALLFSRLANTGGGSDACLRLGFLPMPVNYYSPVPDIADLERRNIWDRRSRLTGIDFQPDNQVTFLAELGREFGHECGWPAHSTGRHGEFYTENTSFSFGCAAGTHTIIRRFKPGRVFEIGSGNSSKVIAAALTLNARESTRVADYTIIDPYPSPTLEREVPGVTRLLRQRAELLEPEFFDQLEAHDILFIDSGHTVRIGGDVNFLFLDVLPRLASGVIVHIHDIGLPYEYPKVYATNPAFRVFWTEAYLLQAFLCYNAEYEILLAMAYLMTDRKEAFRSAFPRYDPHQHVSVSGSFWIRRK